MTQQFPPGTSNPDAGPDFPGSSGDRERGKFRRGRKPRETAVAVTKDTGEEVAGTLEDLVGELLVYQKATLLALSHIDGWTVEELLDGVEE